MTKVLAVASGGGHWVELRRLRPAFAEFDVAYVTVQADYFEDVPGHRFYTVRDASRFEKWGFVVLIAQLVRVLLIERPDVVITTGSAPGFVTLALAKFLLRAKTIWIDSIANYETMSSSGKQARRVADVWLTQWPHLKRPEGPDCWGAVI